MTGQAGQAPGVVKVRLLGAPGDIDTVAAVLAAGHGDTWQVIDRSAPYPSRRGPGARLYLTLTITTQAGGPRDE